MVEVPHVRINLPERSYQAVARSEIKKMAEAAGLKGHRLGEFEIVVAEITSNLLKHSSKGGYLLVRIISSGAMEGIELIAIDAGKGMRNASKMIEDGLSTTKTLGQGLGAIKRLTNIFDIYSQVGWGTILFTRTYISKDFIEPAEAIQTGVINICYPGQKVSGDTWKIHLRKKEVRVMLADGLGHGQHASEAAAAATKSFLKSPKVHPAEQLRQLHPDIKQTRGAVINIVHIDTAGHQLSYCGVGNISMKVLSSTGAKGCFSYNGIVGHIMPAVLNNHLLQVHRNDLVVLHTDGISARWDLQKYPGVGACHASVLCAAVYKDFDRGTDDSTIVAIKMTFRTNG